MLRHTVVICGFEKFASSTSFSKKGDLSKRAGLLWYVIVDLNLVGLCDRNVELNTKCALVKVLENVEEHEPLPKALLKIFNTKKQNTCRVCYQKQ